MNKITCKFCKRDLEPLEHPIIQLHKQCWEYLYYNGMTSIEWELHTIKKKDDPNAEQTT